MTSIRKGTVCRLINYACSPCYIACMRHKITAGYTLYWSSLSTFLHVEKNFNRAELFDTSAIDIPTEINVNYPKHQNIIMHANIMKKSNCIFMSFIFVNYLDGALLILNISRGGKAIGALNCTNDDVYKRYIALTNETIYRISLLDMFVFCSQFFFI